MRRLGLIMFVFLAGHTVTVGQNKNVRKAQSALEKGELAEAKAQIDPAINDEKTKDEGDTWYTYGEIYQAIGSDSTNSVQADNPYKKALEAFEKVQALEEEGSVNYTMAVQKIEEIWANNVNKGAALYSDKDYENAIQYFNTAKMARPQDTTAYIYAGISAQQAGDLDAAAENYAFLVDSLDYESQDFYNSLIYIYLVEKKDNEKALNYLRNAQELFPENGDFLKQEITLLINNQQYEEAEQKLDKAIEQEPDNAILFYNRGYLAEQMGNGENAIENYKKAIELDPSYFDATFNLAAYYYNKAAETLTEVNNMDLKDYETQGKAIEDSAMVYFQDALPYLERSQEIKPDEPKVLQTLQTVYSRLKMDEKAEEVQSKLDNM